MPGRIRPERVADFVGIRMMSVSKCKYRSTRTLQHPELTAATPLHSNAILRNTLIERNACGSPGRSDWKLTVT